jgi:hypothetical protein
MLFSTVIFRMAGIFPLQTLSQIQDSKLEELFCKLIPFKNALYNAETRRKMFIRDGCCLKQDCKFKASFGILKVLLPKSLMPHFEVGIIKEDRIGKAAVVCFDHFFFEHKIHYLHNGVFPQEVCLMGRGDNFLGKTNSSIEKKPISVSHRGAKHDNDWVCNLTSFNIVFSLSFFFGS